VFVVGFFSVLLPEKQVAQYVGDNSLRSNLALVHESIPILTANHPTIRV
jgi:uncharacterized membrane protein YraQ (UPF0718 family)